MRDKHEAPLHAFERDTGELVEYFWRGGALVDVRIDGDDKPPLSIRRTRRPELHHALRVAKAHEAQDRAYAAELRESR